MQICKRAISYMLESLIRDNQQGRLAFRKLEVVKTTEGIK